MLAALRAKFSQRHQLRTLLLGTGCAELIEHTHKSGGGNHNIGKIACLNIGQRIKFPISAPDKAQARILPFAGRIRPLKPQSALVVQQTNARLHFDIG